MKTEASHFFSGAYFDNQYYDQKPQLDINNNNNQFTIDELLDFSNEDESLTDGFFGNSADSSTLTDLDTYNYNTSQTQFSGDFSCTHAQFSTNQLCVPDDELAELEWLSNFVEESFSTDDLQNFHLISATKAPTDSSSSEFRPQTMPPSTHAPPLFHTSVSVPGKARSKRSRAAPCDWSSRLLVLKKTEIETKEKGPTRKCLHCGSDKTPQWRSGPMGPKTLCNACGVRFKSGRLVPEYRPAASPTFVSAKHSNSHRKVMELRRQKELQVAHQQQLLSQTPIFGVSNGQDYLIHPPCGPTFRHMI